MIKILNKSILIIFILVVSIIGLVSCNKNNIENDNKVTLNGTLIEKSKAKALSIDEINISQIHNKENNGMIIDKIKNVSDFNISDIWIIYNELDNDGKIISESKMFLDMTLLPGDVFKATFKVKEASEGINITSYAYTTNDNDVVVNLKDGSVKVSEKSNEVVESGEYEVLSFSDIEKIEESNDGDTYVVKMKNNSSKNLGNITLKIVEINKKGEYIKINHESSYSALKPLEEAEITIKSYKYTEEIKLIGYIYDDVDTKSNIDIDLESKEAQISKY
ncbi:hypothetical protein [Romboutsia sp. 1001713B170207_170306_H8]|uniref:hypothetical protein n=1 Tax=Romboutsia sp. 1001713B170207_170306_H8 TaxID=2787112 RepID=UPI00082279DD|nr:hypothetical protein [Romboutsia sp. 1001713B170207_170306_H8]SCI16585.1 Uncharacterised protein [uncultured Clostridium sp.]